MIGLEPRMSRFIVAALTHRPPGAHPLQFSKFVKHLKSSFWSCTTWDDLQEFNKEGHLNHINTIRTFSGIYLYKTIQQFHHNIEWKQTNILQITETRNADFLYFLSICKTHRTASYWRCSRDLQGQCHLSFLVVIVWKASLTAVRLHHAWQKLFILTQIDVF